MIGAILAASPSSQAQKPDIMKGKTKTDHTIMLEKIVDATPAEAFRLWSTAEGVKTFFAPDARIGSKPGDEYTIMFFPADDPQGLVHGTKGARILEMVPGKKLTFEWIVFAADKLKGSHAPPYAAPEIRNEDPLPTWVELTFEPTADNKTRIVFRHYGFRDGELWAESYRWFTRAWSGVLENWPSKQVVAALASKG
ncbi:MAG: hypothetical protein QOJ64_2544 [Acidobacteriota bacterium]|jgi:uncharacterized protein YndB with AHSA1/START domain|nr:hypothetical protein [Acidobacteriota bacterium]